MAGQLLKGDLQSQLHVESFSGTDARSAVVVANGVRSNSKSAAETTAGRREIGAVKQVVEFHAELRVDAFGYFRILDDGKVHVGESRAVEIIAGQVAVRSGCGLRKGCGIYPLNSRFVECMGNTGVGITDQIGALNAFICTSIVSGSCDVKRLAGVKRQKAGELPTTKQGLEVRRTWQVVIEKRGEVVARIEVAVAVVTLNVEAVLRYGAAISGHVVEGVRPSVSELRRETVPLTNFQNGLEGVVVGVSVALNLVDDAEVRELCEVRTAGLLRGCGCGCGCGCGNFRRSYCESVGWRRRGLVDVLGGQQAMSGAADVTDLQQQRSTEAFLDIEVVIVV